MARRHRKQQSGFHRFPLSGKTIALVAAQTEDHASCQDLIGLLRRNGANVVEIETHSNGQQRGFLAPADIAMVEHKIREEDLRHHLDAAIIYMPYLPSGDLAQGETPLMDTLIGHLAELLPPMNIVTLVAGTSAQKNLDRNVADYLVRSGVVYHGFEDHQQEFHAKIPGMLSRLIAARSRGDTGRAMGA